MKVYECKDGRTRVYDPKTKKVRSYPRYLMEQHLGRSLLDDEDVHHIDKNPLNNDISNLEVVMHGEHQRRHSKKYFDKVMICSCCGEKFVWTGRQQQIHAQNIKRPGRRDTGLIFCSRKCAGIYGRKIQSKQKAGVS